MSDPGCLTAIVTYEDRLPNEVGIKLLVLSLEEHFPEASIHVFNPNATEDLLLGGIIT